ncbi:MAG: FliI/YscN family ATPase [Pseudomonadota bacterium]
METGYRPLPPTGIDYLCSAVKRTATRHALGRIATIASDCIWVSGLSRVACVGDRVSAYCERDPPKPGEIVGLEGELVRVVLEGSADGLSLGARMQLQGPTQLAPDDSWIGRVLDANGAPFDERPLRPGLVDRTLLAPAPSPINRRLLGPRLETGMSVFNTLLPLVRGQRLGLFAGSGVGKTTLVARFATNVQADVVVIALIGERGREVREFVERILGPDGLRRTVVVAATSDQPALVRRRCAWTAMTIAEHFRDQGRHVLFLADSVTRFAEAHREVAVAAGEGVPARGYPASTAGLVTALCERAGTGTDVQGDITAIFSVLVAGSDMDEPLADLVRGVLDGHVVLSREVAETGRYPAVDLVRSVSRSLPDAASPEEIALINETRKLLGAYEKAELMVRAGLYTPGADPITDRAVACWPALDAFAGRPETVSTEASFVALRHALQDPGAA